MEIEELLESRGPSLELLTDEAIMDFTTDESGNSRVLTDYRDANMRYTPFRPWKGGVYDLEIFGSPYVDQCLCGKRRGVTDQPCPNCGSMVYPLEESLRRFARIELPFYYLNDLRFDLFREVFNDIFQDTTIKFDFVNDDLKAGGYSETKNPRRFGIKVFDSCQFNYNPKKDILVISEFITDESKCSYEGIIEIVKTHFPSRLNDIMKLVNRLYLVLPAVMRPFIISRASGGKKKSVSHQMSIWYSAVIRLCCAEAKDTNNQNYEVMMQRFKTPGERVRYTALLRAFINAGKKEVTTLLNTSKENLSRILYSVRNQNSARCPIIPSTTRKIDEVGVPIHLAYEMCRSGFIKYLQEKLNFTYEQAKRSTAEEYNNPRIQQLFKEYAEKQYVIH